MALIGKGRLGENDKLQGGASILVIHEYYTNYDKSHPLRKFEVLATKSSNLVGPKLQEVLAPSWWKFKTNLDPNDFDFVMTESQIKSFLNRMWEMYRYRKVE